MARAGTTWLEQGIESIGARREQEEKQAAADVIAQRKVENARSAAEMSRWSGLPVETVIRNRATIESDRAALRATSALARAPGLGRWIAQDQRNAASVSGDEVNAAAVSYWFGDGPGSYADDYATGVEGKPAWLVDLQRQGGAELGKRRTSDEILRSAQQRTRAAELREQQIEAGRPDATAGSFSRGVLSEAKQGFRQSWIGTKMFIADTIGIPTESAVFQEMLEEKAESDRIRRAYRPRFDERNWGGYIASSAYGGTASLLQMVPALAAAPVTSGTSLLTLLGLQSGTQQYAEVRGRGGNRDEAAISAAGVGVVEAATEALPMGFLVGQFGKMGAGQFLSGFLGRELVTEQFATHIQDAIDTAIANPDKTWGEYLAERPDAAFDTMVAVGIMSGAVGGANALYRRMQPVQRDLSEATDAIAGARFLDQAIGLAQESKMRTDDPVAFRSFIEAHTAGSPVENVYVPADALQSFFQSADFDANVHDGWAQYAEQAREAAAIGGDVVMSTADAMQLLSEGNAWETLRDSVRLSPGGISLEEARSIEQSYLDLMEARGAETATEAAEGAREQAPGRQVYDFVLSRARASGMSLNAATAYADIYQQRYETRAAQRGTDAWSLFRESVGDIRGEAPAVVRRYRTTDQLPLIVNVMQRGKERESEGARRGASLLEFIAARGGIEDPGGDIAAMGGGDWHRQSPFRRRLLRDAAQAGMFAGQSSGYSINDHMIAALEAGYFPELAANRSFDVESEALDERVLLEAIGRELAGEPVYSDEVGGSANMADDQLRLAAEDMAEYLLMQGLDPYSMSVEEIRAALEPADPQVAASFAQGVPPDTFEVDGVERPTRNSLGRPISPTVEGLRAFWRWFGDSKVVDAQGRPVVVFRGEHGDTAEGALDFQSRLPSVSFGSVEAANLYATEPNNYNDTAVAPRVTPAYLKIERPIVNDPDDPFVDLSRLEEAVGRDRAIEAAGEFADAIENTGRWMEEINESGEFAGVVDFLAKHPDRLGELYFDAYRLLDDDLAVRLLSEAGFDGAIHGGNGATALDTEYRIFSSQQAKAAFANSGAFADGGRMLEQSAWHVSPHEFSQFSTEFMGTGEGAQSFGWGLYFAESEEVRRAYEQAFTSTRYKVGSEAVDFEQLYERFLQVLEPHPDLLQPFPRLVFEKGGLDVIDELGLDMLLDEELNGANVLFASVAAAQMDGVEAEGSAADYAGWIERKLRGMAIEADDPALSTRLHDLATVAASSGIASAVPVTYKVEIPDEDTMLLWDRPLSEQPPKVREAIWQMERGSPFEVREVRYAGRSDWSIVNKTRGGDVVAEGFRSREEAEKGLPDYERGWAAARSRSKVYAGSELTGEQFYRLLSGGLTRAEDVRPSLRGWSSNDRGASEALLAAGIHGIKYLDGGSRGEGGGSYNFVVFDGAQVVMMEKRRQDAVFWRNVLAPPEGYSPIVLHHNGLENLPQGKPSGRHGNFFGTREFSETFGRDFGAWRYTYFMPSDVAEGIIDVSPTTEAGRRFAVRLAEIGYPDDPTIPEFVAEIERGDAEMWSELYEPWTDAANIAAVLREMGAPGARYGQETFLLPEAVDRLLDRRQGPDDGTVSFYQSAKAQAGDPWFYSALDRAVQAGQAKASAEQWLGTLRNAPGVKAEELEWSGLVEYLEFQRDHIEGPVEREAILQFLRTGGVRVEEVVLGEAKPREVRELAERLMEEEAQRLAREEVDEFYDSDGAGSDVPEVLEAFEGGSWSFDGQEFDTEEAAEEARDAAIQSAEDEAERERFNALRDMHYRNLREEEFFEQAKQQLGAPQFSEWTSSGQATGADAGPSYRELLLTLPIGVGRNPKKAPRTHWEQEGVVAHMRFQEKRDEQGRPVLFLEELQSDWHQKGREEGYTTPDGWVARASAARKKLEDAQARLAEVWEAEKDAIRAIWNQQRDLTRERLEIDLEEGVAEESDLARHARDFQFGPDNWSVFMPTMAVNALRYWPKADPDNEGWASLDRYVEARAVADLAESELRTVTQLGGGIPDAPFRSSWPTLLLKRAIRWAVDNGYHSVAWTHGAEQGERYGLTYSLGGSLEIWRRADGQLIVKPEDSIAEDAVIGRFNLEENGGPNDRGFLVPTERLEEVFGRDLAKQVSEAAEGQGGEMEPPAVLRGNLVVGGEGMIEFYDRMVPRAARDLIKRYGGKVAPMGLMDPDAYDAARKLIADTRAKGDELVRGQAERAAQSSYDAANNYEAGLRDEFTNPEFVRLGFEITPDLADTARRGFALFQGGGDKPRGRIDFEASGRAVINLFENADLSTLLHESGHLWLEELRADAARPDAPQQVKDDWRVVKSWFRDNGYRVSSGATAIPVDAHEMWARGFERYAMEGKAPSSALARAFRSFSAWLLRLYRHVNNLDTPLTDEVRSVMDRLLATQEAIDAASAGLEQDQIFKDAAEAGMTEEEFAAWRASIGNAKTAAFEALLYRTMEAVRKRRTALWDQRKQSVTTEVWSEVSRRPEFRALNILRGRGHPRMPLDRDAVIDEFGSETLAMIPRGVPPTVVSEGGFSPQLVAEAAGFRTAGEMMTALIGIEQRQRELRAAGDKRTTAQEEVDRLVERAMLERFGDSLSDGSIEEEALAEIHNDQHGDRLASELRALGRKSPRSTDAVPTPWQQAKAWAERVVEEGVVSEQATAAALARHQRNEGKARRAAAEAFRAGDHAEAFRQKQRELYHAALYRAASRAKDQVDVIVKRLGKLAKARKHASIHWEYLDRIQQLLEHFDFRRRSVSQLKERTAFSKWVEAKREAGEEVYVPERLLDADAVNFMQMKFADLVALDDTVESLAHLGRRKKQLLAGQEEAQLEDVVAEAVARGESLPALPVSLQRNPEPNLRAQARSFDAELIKMERMADYLDNGDPNGAFNRVLIQPATEAANYKQRLTDEVLRPIQETYLAMPRDQQKRLARRVLVPEMVTIDENGAPQPTDYSGMDLIAIALNIGNESNLSKMLRGESRDLPEEHAWTVEKVMTVLNRELTEQDWQLVQTVWRRVNSLWPHIVQAERELTGVKPEKVIARPVQTPFGSIEGGYYPVVYDPLRSQLGRDNADEMASKMFGGMGRVVSTPKGHTITRTQAAAPLMLSVEGVLLHHVDKVATRIAYGRFVRDALKFTSHDDIRRLIHQRMGPEYYPLFKSWLSRQTNDAAMDVRMLRSVEKFLRAARKNVTMVGLGFRVTTMFAQVAGWTQSVGVIGERWMVRGLIETARNLGKNSQLVFAKSEEMSSRLEEFDREVRDTFRDMAGTRSRLDKIRAFGFWGIINVQMHMVDIPTWWGAYYKGQEGGMSEAEAIAFADKAVRRSQSSGRVKDLSEIQTGTEAHKMMTLFYSFFNAYYNLQGQVVEAARLGNWKGAAHTTFWVMMIGPFLGALLTGDWPDEGEDGELGLDDLAAWMGRKFFFGLFAGIPIARDFANGIDRKIAGEFSAPPSTPIVRVWEEFETFVDDSIGLARGDDEVDGRWVQRAITLPGYLFGLPTGQLGTTSRYVYDVANEDVEPEDAGDVAYGLVKGRQPEE